MTNYTQLFDGGATGTAIDSNTTSSTGSSMWFAGTGTATFTTTSPVHGSTASLVTAATGSSQAVMVLNLEPSVRDITVQAYYRVPSIPATGGAGLMYLSSQNTGIHFVISGDGSVLLSSWQGSLGTGSAAGVVPAVGAPVRLAMRSSIGGKTITAAAYAAESTTPLWTTTAALPPAVLATDSFDNVQFGVTTSSNTSRSIPVTIDSIRAQTGSSSAFLPPEQAPTSNNPRRAQIWYHTGTTWRNTLTGRTITAT